MPVPQASDPPPPHCPPTPACSCPYLRRASDPDEPSYFLELFYDPEYTLFEGCQCDQVWTLPTCMALIGTCVALIGTRSQCYIYIQLL